jgi:arylsulfatase A-like enzyme
MTQTRRKQANVPPNILLIVMDSVRAANTSLHGHEHETTPYLEELAEEAVVYEQARSPGTWSLPSHTSMFTGYHVVEHGITRARHQLEPGHTIFEELRDDHDYATGVFSENTWITDMPVGLQRAFETVEGARNLPYPDSMDPTNFVLSEGQGQYLQYLKRCLSHEHPVRSMTNGVFSKLAWDYPQLLPDQMKSSTPASVYGGLFLDWQADRTGPWAACVNFMDAHLPYQPDEEYDLWGGKRLRRLQDGMDDQVWEFNGGQRPWWQRKALEGLYDGTVRQIDAQVQCIVEALRERGVLDDTLVVITSDHGEGFGEPSRIRPDARVAAHGAGIHEALCHVPLVVHPIDAAGGKRIAEPASLTQFPTVVRQALRGDSVMDGFVPSRHVVVSSHGLEEPMEERALRYTDNLYRFNGDCRAVYERGGDLVQKYLSWRDRRCRVDIGDVRASWRVSDIDDGRVDEEFAATEDLGVRRDASEDVDETTQQRLKDLGYM